MLPIFKTEEAGGDWGVLLGLSVRKEKGHAPSIVRKKK